MSNRVACLIVSSLTKKGFIPKKRSIEAYKIYTIIRGIKIVECDEEGTASRIIPRIRLID